MVHEIISRLDETSRPGTAISGSVGESRPGPLPNSGPTVSSCAFLDGSHLEP